MLHRRDTVAVARSPTETLADKVLFQVITQSLPSAEDDAGTAVSILAFVPMLTVVVAIYLPYIFCPITNPS